MQRRTKADIEPEMQETMERLIKIEILAEELHSLRA
jgi:hypothetical protein